MTRSLRRRVMCRRRYILVSTRLNCLTWWLRIGIRRIAWKRVVVSRSGGCMVRISLLTWRCLVRNMWLVCRHLIGPFASTLPFMTGRVVIVCRRSRFDLRAWRWRCGLRVVVMNMCSVVISLIVILLKCLRLMNSS